MESGQISGASMAKRLASCNKSSRDRAVRFLHSWLPSAAETLTDSDLIKIWKGLFYCVWHADKLPNQIDLVNRLSAALETLDFPASIRYLDAFLITIRREWCGIDRLRLDKFYLLIRKFIGRSFALLKKNGWNRDLMESFIALLKEKSFLSKDKFQANGVNFFIAEVFLEEMEGFFPAAPETLGFLLDMFVSVLERSNDRVLVIKVRVNVFEKLVEAGMRYLDGDTNELGKYALVLGFSDKFLKSASDPETVQGNRKVLFGLRDSFLKLERDFEKSGLEVLFENVGNVVTVNSAENDTGVSDDRPAKKRKKAKCSVDRVDKTDKTKKKKSQQSVQWLSDSAIKSDGKVVANCGNVVESNGADKKKSKRKKKSLDSAVECNAGIDETAANGGDVVESNDADKKKSKRKKKSLDSAVECNAGIDETAANGGNVVESNDADKKKSKRKKKSLDSAVECNAGIDETAVEDVDGDLIESGDILSFDENVISNLQKQFEKVAAEAGMSIPATPVNRAVPKKRKRAKSAEAKANGVSMVEKSGDKSVKKVSFSIKNNIVWKPQTPLPPQSLRLPPSTTPRGSALKKGVPPGPVKGTPPTMKKIKAKGSSVKKGPKSLKRLRKLQGFSV